MKPAPLVLEYYFVERFEFGVNAHFDPKQPPELRFEDFQMVPNVEILAAQEETLFDKRKDLMRAQIRLTIGFQPSHEGNFPYTFQISLVGLFGVQANATAIDPLNLLQVNGPSILFGAAREIIANFTSRG